MPLPLATGLNGRHNLERREKKVRENRKGRALDEGLL